MKTSEHFFKYSDAQEEEIIPGYRARFVHSKNMTVAYWDISEGALLPEHAHIEEQITHVIQGSFVLIMDGQAYTCVPDTVVVIPSNTPHSGRAISDCKIIDVFSPVRKDYLAKYQAVNKHLL